MRADVRQIRFPITAYVRQALWGRAPKQAVVETGDK